MYSRSVEFGFSWNLPSRREPLGRPTRAMALINYGENMRPMGRVIGSSNFSRRWEREKTRESVLFLASPGIWKEDKEYMGKGPSRAVRRGRRAAKWRAGNASEEVKKFFFLAFGEGGRSVSYDPFMAHPKDGDTPCARGGNRRRRQHVNARHAGGMDWRPATKKGGADSWRRSTNESRRLSLKNWA
jgi:hypothetical protein